MTRATSTTIRPLTPGLTNIVPPDRDARYGWLLVHVGVAASTAGWRDKVKFTHVFEHITAGAGLEVRGVS